MPRHSRIIRPVTATDTRKRGRVSKTTTARHGGNLARADFHVTPPLGSSIVEDHASVRGIRDAKRGESGMEKEGRSKTVRASLSDRCSFPLCGCTQPHRRPAQQPSWPSDGRSCNEESKTRATGRSKAHEGRRWRALTDSRERGEERHEESLLCFAWVEEPTA